MLFNAVHAFLNCLHRHIIFLMYLIKKFEGIELLLISIHEKLILLYLFDCSSIYLLNSFIRDIITYIMCNVRCL